jgi:hypothetical protein
VRLAGVGGDDRIDANKVSRQRRGGHVARADVNGRSSVRSSAEDLDGISTANEAQRLFCTSSKSRSARGPRLHAIDGTQA